MILRGSGGDRRSALRGRRVFGWLKHSFKTFLCLGGPLIAMAFARLIGKFIALLSSRENRKKLCKAPASVASINRKQKQDRLYHPPPHRSSGIRKNEFLVQLYMYFRRDRKALAALVAVVISLAFYKYVLPVYVLLLFIVVASLSKLVQDFIPFVVGFDLVLFVTVLSGVAYGWTAALVAGTASSLVGSSIRRVSSQQFDTIFFPALGYAIIAAVLPYIPYADVFWLGMICTFIYVGMMELVFAYLRPDIFNHITFGVTAVLFNYWLFKNFAQPILSLIALAG